MQRMHTFGSRLKSFAQATDIISEDRFRDIIYRVTSYLTKHLASIKQVIIAVQEVDRGREYLVGAWPPESIAKIHRTYRNEDGTYWRKPIKDDEDTFCGQSSFVFTKQKPGWFVAVGKGVLADAKEYRDLFGNHTVIPGFVPALDGAFKTSVIFPLRVEHGFQGVFGVVNFEFDDYIVPNDYWKADLGAIADALAILFQLRRAYVLQDQASRQALQDLEYYDVIPVGQPSALMFTSSRADARVRGVIRSSLSNYETQFRLRAWDDLRQPVDIVPEIRQAARNALIGIAYLSEPAPSDGKHRFQDNTNVIYELGLLHGIMESGVSPLKGALILREKNSLPAPFNYAGTRRIDIERSQDGDLNEDRLKSDLTLVIDEITGS